MFPPSHHLGNADHDSQRAMTGNAAPPAHERIKYPLLFENPVSRCRSKLRHGILAACALAMPQPSVVPAPASRSPLPFHRRMLRCLTSAVNPCDVPSTVLASRIRVGLFHQNTAKLSFASRVTCQRLHPFRSENAINP
jgi:hypothetical protein